jgi:hypothetical protein
MRVQPFPCVKSQPRLCMMHNARTLRNPSTLSKATRGVQTNAASAGPETSAVPETSSVAQPSSVSDWSKVVIDPSTVPDMLSERLRSMVRRWRPPPSQEMDKRPLPEVCRLKALPLLLVS